MHASAADDRAFCCWPIDKRSGWPAGFSDPVIHGRPASRAWAR